MIITCEQVSMGHPDKICDQISDAVVTDCLIHDPNARVGIECLAKNNVIVIAGELTSNHTPDYSNLVMEVINRIGLSRTEYATNPPNIQLIVDVQSPDIAQGVDVGGAGDQGMMYGYATNETPEMLPIPFVLATDLLQLLDSLHDPRLKADAKAQVSFDYDSGSIVTFLCSVQHREDVSLEEVSNIVKPLMEQVASARGYNTDFTKLVNPTGRFVVGGPFGDCGLTGRKLACDTYGSIGHIGGGAMSGKDPTKVDRSGAYMMRKIAKDCVRLGYCDKCEVQVAYAIGLAEPVSVNVDCFGTEHQSMDFIENFIRKNYILTPKEIIKTLSLRTVDYNKVSAYGHFGKNGLPWEA